MEMFYTRDNRWALGRGVRGMHCIACDAELILTNVVPENTVAVRGFEHHTFICSGCHSTVRRVVFNEKWGVRKTQSALQVCLAM